MTNNIYEFYYRLLLEWYELDPGNKLIGEEEIHLSQEELALLMKLDPSEYPFSGGVHSLESKEEISIIQKLVKHEIKVDSYSYCISCYSISDHPYNMIKDHSYWSIIEKALFDLEKNDDISLKTESKYVCGIIVYELLCALGKVKYIPNYKRKENSNEDRKI